jgi:hypothetical protein
MMGTQRLLKSSKLARPAIVLIKVKPLINLQLQMTSLNPSTHQLSKKLSHKAGMKIKNLIVRVMRKLNIMMN